MQRVSDPADLAAVGMPFEVAGRENPRSVPTEVLKSEVTHTPIYSPSQTETWAFCPVKRALQYQERWRSRYYGKRELAAILGRGVGAGLASYFSKATVTSPDLVAALTVDAGIAELESLGARCTDWHNSQKGATAERARVAVSKYIALHERGEGIPRDWTIL